jgi:hypothetical protein
MSRGARWTLGVCALLFLWMFVYASADLSSPIAKYVPALFCFAIAVACFVPLLRGLAVRFIGAVVFATCTWSLYEEWKAPLGSYHGRSEPHLFNAILAMVVFGAPALYVVLTGSYPRWGKASMVFRPAERHAKPAKFIG